MNGMISEQLVHRMLRQLERDGFDVSYDKSDTPPNVEIPNATLEADRRTNQEVRQHMSELMDN